MRTIKVFVCGDTIYSKDKDRKFTQSVQSFVRAADDLFPKWKYIYGAPNGGSIIATLEKRILVPPCDFWHWHRIVPKDPVSSTNGGRLDSEDLIWSENKILVIKKKDFKISGGIKLRKKLRKQVTQAAFSRLWTWRYIYIEPGTGEFVASTKKLIHDPSTYGDILVTQVNGYSGTHTCLGIFMSFELLNGVI
jgi:hypothetical protein